MKNDLWETEEFEDLIERGIISLYEGTHKEWKKIASSTRIKPKELSMLRKLGLYFSPGDRMTSAHDVDILNDGLPQHAIISEPQEQTETPIFDKSQAADILTGYLYSHWMIRQKIGAKMPKNWGSTGDGVLYAKFSLVARNEGGLIGTKRYVRINSKTGRIYPCVRTQQYHNGFKHVTETVEGPTLMKVAEQDITTTACTIGLYTDKRHLWNVAVSEDSTRNVLFGVYPEQIQSLFYARDLPMTVTGRKRPILHWVSAHKRRIKEGTEVDVKKHMRGITSFEMNGTTFNITEPIKKL